MDRHTMFFGKLMESLMEFGATELDLGYLLRRKDSPFCPLPLEPMKRSQSHEAETASPMTFTDCLP